MKVNKTEKRTSGSMASEKEQNRGIVKKGETVACMVRNGIAIRQADEDAGSCRSNCNATDHTTIRMAAIRTRG